MPIFACGINYKTASIDLREKVLFAPEKIPVYLNDLVTEEGIQDAVLLSTCNRSELYCAAEDAGQVKDWFQRQHCLADFRKSFYLYQDQEAIEHIMNVACGLDSMVLGESQVLGQMKNAFSESCAAGAVGPTFNRLFQQVFAIVKEVRTNTSIGACPMSVASATVQFLKHHYKANFADARLLILGAGMTAELILRHIKPLGLHRVTLINRSIQRAEALAAQYAGVPLHLSHLDQALGEADIVISTTGSPTTLITPQKILPFAKPFFMIDIAVPRDIDASVATLPQVALYSIDDLKTTIQQNRIGLEHAAEKARDMIKQKSQHFMDWLAALDQVAHTIRSYRKKVEDLCHTELQKAQRQLQKGEASADVLAGFAYALTNKLLHTPTVQLRQAGLEGRLEVLQLAQQLFAISEVT